MILCLSLGFGLGLLAAVGALHVDTRRARRRARKLTVAPFFRGNGQRERVVFCLEPFNEQRLRAQDSTLT